MSVALQALSIGSKVENVLINGDLKALTPEERVQYYNKVCDSLGLNALTRPLEYVTLNGKLTLYARKDATDQLRRIHKVSIDSVTVSSVGDLYVVVANGSCGERKDSATGVINVKSLSGEALANAMMKAETKAKRRLTLSICGLGLLDEMEIDDAHNQAAHEKIVEANKRFEDPALPSDSKEEIREGYIAVKTAFGEREKQQKLKGLGFKWEPKIKAWVIPYSGTVPENLEFEFEVLDLNFG